MGGMLKIMGWAFGGMGAFVFAGFTAAMIAEDDFSEAAGLVIPALFIAAGVGLWRLGRLNQADARFDLPQIGKWVFMSVGAVMVIGGVVLTFDDPAGLFLIFMGAVFCGAGWLAGAVFATPEGRKKVFVEQTSGIAERAIGGDVTVTSGTYIEVDEDATEDEVRAAVDDWRDAMLDRRPGWRSGRLAPNSAHLGAMKFFPPIVIILGLGLIAGGWYGDEFLFYFGFLPLGVGLFLLVAVFRAWRRRRIFGRSILALRTSPLSPGDTLDAVLEIPAPRRMFAGGRFTLTLECARVTRSEDANDRATYDTQTLWSDQKTHSASGETSLKVKVRFALPDDLPPATLVRSAAARIRWSLQAEAGGTRANYLETFDLPVLPA